MEPLSSCSHLTVISYALCPLLDALGLGSLCGVGSGTPPQDVLCSPSTPERQSLFESHRQRRWLTIWSYCTHRPTTAGRLSHSDDALRGAASPRPGQALRTRGAYTYVSCTRTRSAGEDGLAR